MVLQLSTWFCPCADIKAAASAGLHHGFCSRLGPVFSWSGVKLTVRSLGSCSDRDVYKDLVVVVRSFLQSDKQKQPVNPGARDSSGPLSSFCLWPGDKLSKVLNCSWSSISPSGMSVIWWGFWGEQLKVFTHLFIINTKAVHLEPAAPPTDQVDQRGSGPDSRTQTCFGLSLFLFLCLWQTGLMSSSLLCMARPVVHLQETEGRGRLFLNSSEKQNKLCPGLLKIWWSRFQRRFI